MNNVELSKTYLPLLDEVYKDEVKTSVLDGDEVTVKKGQNGEIKVAKLDMDGLGDFDRNSGYTEGSSTLKWETIKYDKERSQKLKVDRLDNDESLGIMVAKLSSEFIRTKVAPETDAARIAKIAGVEGISKVEEDITTGDEMYKSLRGCTNKMDEDEVPTTNRILFITPTGKGLLDDLETYKSKSVLSRFSQIIEVPQTRMYTAIKLNDGEENYGYTKADDASELNYLAVERSAVVTAMDQFIKYFSPDEDQNGDSHVFPYRNYNLYGHVYENKLAGVYCSYKKKSSLAVVEVSIPSDGTSVNGTNKSVKDIQTGMQLNGDKLTGTSNYLQDITGAGGEGNYLVLELPQAKDEGNTVKCQFEGGEEITLSATDYQYLIKVTEKGKKPITITITGKVNSTRTIDISELILIAKN